MNTQISNTKTIKFKSPIVVISLISLICTIISCIDHFTYYDFNYYETGAVKTLHFGFTNLFDVLWMLLRIAPCFIFFIYVLKFYQKSKAKLLLPITYSLTALLYITHIIYMLYYAKFYFNGWVGLLGFYDVYFSWENGNIIFNIIIVVAFILTTINEYRFTKHKIFALISAIIGLFLEVLQFIIGLGYYSEYMLLEYIIGFVAISTFYVAILLFSLNNIPIANKPIDQKIQKMSPEQAMKYLENEYVCGKISEAEYQKLRAEIINNLISGNNI